MRSIGDKFKIDGRILTQIDLPRNLSFREVLIYVFNVYQSDPNFNFQVQDIPDIKRLIELYERMTFGLELIEELDILEFMIEFEKLIVYCTNNYNGKLTYRAATLPLLQLPPLQTAGGVISSGASYGRRRLYYDSSSFGRRNSAYSRYLYYRGDENKSHRSTKNSYSDYLGTEPLDFGDENHLINFDSKSNSHSSIGVSGSGIGRSGSYKSVIMNKLAIGRKGYREENDPDFNRDMGYASDNEGEFDFVDNQLDDELDDSYVENEDFDSIEPYHGKLQYQKSIGDQTNASDTSEMVATEPNDSEVANYDDKIDDNRNEEIHDDAKDDNDSDDADVFYGFRRKSIIQTD